MNRTATTATGRVRAGAAVLAAGLLAATGCAAIGGTPAAGERLVVIGVDLDLTSPGPGAGYGNGLRLAAEQVNTQQLAGGHQLRLRVLDNRGDAATSADNLASLASDPQVAAIVTSGCGQCVIEAAASLAVPVIALTGNEQVAAPAGERRWVFRLGPNSPDNADTISQAMARDGIHTVAVIATTDPYGREGTRWIQDAAARDGLQVVTVTELDPSAGQSAVDDAAGTVATWQPPPDPFTPPPIGQETGPDAVVVWVPAPHATDVAAALREAGFDGRLYADMTAADELFLSDAGSVWQGATVVHTGTAVADQNIASSPAAAARKQWLLAYVSRHHTYHLHSSFAADALLVLANAVAYAGTTRAGVRDRVESTRLDGISGPIRFTAEQHSGLSPAAPLTLTATTDRWQ